MTLLCPESEEGAASTPRNDRAQLKARWRRVGFIMVFFDQVYRTVRVTLFLIQPRPFWIKTVAENEPREVGVPERRPVAGSRVSPGGRP